MTESNNDSFVRGGWWLFFVWGWNLRDGNGNGQINISNASRMDHQLHIYPQSVTSKKYFLKAVEYDGVKYYGPYDHNVYFIDQLVTAQKLTSIYNRHTMPTVAPTLPDLTLDFRALSTNGTTFLGGYNMGEWGSHSNIEGTIILNYSRSSVDRRWACLNAAGICDNATQFYGIDYDERWNLTEEITQSGEIFKGMDTWGTQPQAFNPSTRTIAYATDVPGMPNVTLYYKIPKVLSKTNAELCNHIASKRINQYVPMYGGLPVTNLPGNGKVKFKYRCVTKNRLMDTNVSDTVTIVFKTKQFENVELSAETNKVYEKTINNSDWTTCEFEINDAKRDGSTVLYVKIAPANSENYVRFDIDGAITFTE